MRVIDYYIILAGDLFNSIIIENSNPITKIPAVQLSALLLEYDEIFKRFIEEVKII